jgi:hypothetical protein
MSIVEVDRVVVEIHGPLPSARPSEWLDLITALHGKGYDVAFPALKEGDAAEYSAGAAAANGVKPSTFRSRIAAGWDVARAINWPTSDDRRMAYANGVLPSTFRSRVARGWSKERAISTPARKYAAR